MPNALRIPVNLSHAVKRDSMNLPFEIGELERLWALLRKGDFLQRHQNDSRFGPIVISQLEFPLGELRIPPDAVEEFVDRDHMIRLLYDRCWIPIFGSRTQVLWHSGHLEGLVSFASENSKPQARQRAGSIAAL